MCFIGQTRSGNVFMREFFRELLEKVDFEIKCPYKKGVYKRLPNAYYNVNSTGVSVPSFITSDKEYMLILSFATKVLGKLEEVIYIEFTYKLII